MFSRVLYIGEVALRIPAGGAYNLSKLHSFIFPRLECSVFQPHRVVPLTFLDLSCIRGRPYDAVASGTFKMKEKKSK